MAESRALTLDGTADRTMPNGRALATHAFGYVVGFWWLATGLIIAMQRSAPTRVLALFTATFLMCAGYWELWLRRDSDEALAARRSFLGGAVVWGWISVTFYGGWIMGIAPDRAPPSPSWASAYLAIRAMIFTDVMALVCIALAYLLVRGARNKAGAHGLLAFWIMQQIAKLAVFFGVRNPAGNFLPPHLAHLRQFFGPAENAPFLWFGIATCAVCTVLLVRRARRATTSAARQEAAMLAVLFGLAVLELAILGVRVDAGFWDPFLAARASGG
jgi:putative photosynthetic complex assembly protein 2